ncbi:hypothetical protein Tco_0849759, partial [Tanacetum coccineum]
TMANAEHAPAMAPPVRTDEQILPRIRWVPIGKSNCYLNEEKSQPSPIFKIVVDILKQTNFFRAFTASSTIPAIYIQQFWDTICFDSKAGSYKCQLEEQWFDLTQDTLRDALRITPIDKNQAFSPPPTPDTLIKFVNELGYPREVINLSNVTTNDMFQPQRALATIINLMWEEFTKSIHNFTEDKRNLEQQAQGKKKATIILIPSIQFTKLIICHLQRLHNFHPRPESLLHLPTEEPVLGNLKFSAKRTKREVFGMTIPNELINDVIRGADYYEAYLNKVTRHQRYLAGEEMSDPDSPAPKPAKPTIQTKPKPTKQLKPTEPKTASKKPKPVPAKPQKKKRKPISKQLVDEFIDEGVPAAEPRLKDMEEEILEMVLQESLTDAYPTQRGPLPPVVFRETDTGKFQPLPEVPGKGKEKVGEEQAAQVLINLQTPKKKSPTEQYIFQRRSHIPTETAGREDSTSLYAELGLYGSDTESDEEIPSVVINVEITDPSSQPQPEHMDEGFIAAAYPNVQENLKLTVDEQVIPEEPVSSTGPQGRSSADNEKDNGMIPKLNQWCLSLVSKTISYDILREKLLNVNLLIAKIEALKDNPTPSPDFVTKSSSTSLNFFLEETNTFDNSLPESETFCFNMEEISSGSPTSYSDLSLPDYEALFHDSEPNSGDFTMDVVEDIFDNPTREPRVHVPNILPTHPTLHLDLDFILSSDSLFAYVVRIFLPFLIYPVDPLYLLSSGNEDTIFDPDISIYHSFMLGISHRSRTFMKFNVYPNYLNGSLMEILSSTCSPMDQ